MLKVNLFGKELECQKDKYKDNDRLAVILVDPETKEPYTFITVNLSDASLLGEVIDDENSYEAFINHQPNEIYQQFIQDLVNTGIVYDQVVAEAGSGFNHYVALKFKSEYIDQMEQYRA